jgi:hypothetical protein
MAKATKRQMIEREEDIQAQLRMGREISQFAEELARKHKCSKGSIERQYYNLMKDLAEVQKEKREELRVQMLMRTNHLYQRALEDGNIKNAIDAVNLQSKIGGLYQPEKADKEEKPQAPKFVFKERNLSVVPKEKEDERDAGNE